MHSFSTTRQLVQDPSAGTLSTFKALPMYEKHYCTAGFGKNAGFLERSMPCLVEANATKLLNSASDLNSDWNLIETKRFYLKAVKGKRLRRALDICWLHLVFHIFWCSNKMWYPTSALYTGLLCE